MSEPITPPTCTRCERPASETRRLAKDDTAPRWHCGVCGCYVEAKPASSGYGYRGPIGYGMNTSEDA